MVVGSSCTGFLWNEDDHDVDDHYLITAAHCVVDFDTEQRAKFIRVKFPMVTEYLDAITVGADRETDIAVLKIEDSRWALGLGDVLPQSMPLLGPSSSTTTNDIQPGQSCMVIGKMEQNKNNRLIGTIGAVGMTEAYGLGGELCVIFGGIECD
ncbi:MAG: hypothetical protein SGARI_008320, partial [Bacillariaceae sp.]